MIRHIRIYETHSVDPHYNLALEKRLMDTTAEDECTLYLWQNQNTVVIGQNQNAWAECRTSLLEQEQGKLARRLSGGGAVFHDLGNLNFSFLMSNENYDLDRQVSVIQKACALAGIQAERSGRNDLLAQGRKFSGNAFYHNATHANHHGTLMIHVDEEKLGRYLSPPKAKLAAKGIASVRSRVVNLQSLAPDLTVEAMKTYMKQAFADVYAVPCSTVTLSQEDGAAIAQTQALYSSWEYLYGSSFAFQFDAQTHFSWGHFQLQLTADAGVISGAKVYTDALDWNISGTVEAALVGCRFETGAMQAALERAVADPQVCADLKEFLAEQDL